ncbi:glycosyltransferase family 2 protein [Humidisolicoccus flavus]|uniref:glycosyltransferase family 2 protein n=1 Tax=Humidisolicoccus flavus TaxID=3111414 RepID=UPI003255419A
MLVMTLMVRDEADVIGAMLEHHIRQGVDQFIITDNGSVDGTREIIESFKDQASIDLRDDLEHKKMQGPRVSAMAHDAYEQYGATWVINADADEFWLAANAKDRTLKEVFSEISPTVAKFIVPVIDMIGAPAQAGSGMQRLNYRDERPDSELQKLGLHAHSTPNSVHIGSPNPIVSQGNHFVNIEQRAPLPEELQVEALHFQWRSYEQVSRKYFNAGKAYRESPTLRPSPNHHGMREFRRLETGTLEESYVARHLTPEVTVELEARGEITRDDRIASTVPSPVADVLYSDETLQTLFHAGRVAAIIEQELFATRKELREAQAEAHDLQRRLQRMASSHFTAGGDGWQAERAELLSILEQYRGRRIVRAADSFSTMIRNRKP